GASEPSAPLSTVLDSFWSSGPELEAFHVSALAGDAPDALLRQLGPAPVEVGESNLVEVLAGAYVTLAHAAERRALGEWAGSGSSACGASRRPRIVSVTVRAFGMAYARSWQDGSPAAIRRRFARRADPGGTLSEKRIP